jgi:aryl-alcohol dehydrogenase-like predicted oxidoreductase
MRRRPSRKHSIPLTEARLSVPTRRTDSFQLAPIISAVKSVSKQTGRSMAQVALAWPRHQTVPLIPIIGARKVSQLQDNLASLDLELSAGQLKSLDGASRIELGFPQDIYAREMVRVVRYGGTWDRLLL